MKTKLQNFLVDDVRALIAAIQGNEELAAQYVPGCGFETLGDFAAYWNAHIGKIAAV